MQSKTVKRFVNVTAWLVQECGGGFVQEFGCGGALLSIPPAAGVAQK